MSLRATMARAVHLVIECYPRPQELKPGKNVHDTAWADHGAAEAEVEASRRRLREQGSKPG